MKNLALLIAPLVFSTLFAAEGREIYEGQTQPAANPLQIHLFPEPEQLRGWIGGIAKPAGQTVEIDDGETRHTAKLDNQGRFHWSGNGKKLTVRFADEERVVTLPPPDENAEAESIAFFVVDRSVCRPQTKLQFAAFLRKRNDRGSFTPVKDAEVDVLLTSKAKGIRAATLTLKTDDFGRVVGDYTFADADPRDDYTLKVKGFSGTASMKLAEFRKAKVRLDISHEQPDAETLKLTFRALDFLEKSVDASSLQFEAEVIRKTNANPRIWGLDPKQHPSWKDSDDGHWYALSTEQQALSLAGIPVLGSDRTVPAHRVSKTLEVDENGKGEFFLMLDPAWKHGHVLEVTASIIDGNEREQRAFKRIPLTTKPNTELQMELDQTEVMPGEAIKVSVFGPPDQSLSLLTFRLQTQLDWDVPNSENGNPFLQPNGLMVPGSSVFRGRSARFQNPNPPQPFHRISREFHSVSHPKPVKGAEAKAEGLHRSTIRLGKPGAYMIQALLQTNDGREVAVEQTVVVLPEERASGVFVELDSDRVKKGEPLKGKLHSRFEGAQVLLALRDGNGVQVLHPVTGGNEATNFEIPLPENLTLGCELTARYTDNTWALHLHRRPFAVEPKASRLEITSKMPDTVEPGEEVTMNLSVNRKEKTALVVSIYDQSLLGIAPDPGIDGPSLFHADVRVEDGLTDSMLESYLGDLTLNQLKQDLDAFFEQQDRDSPDEEAALVKHLRQWRSHLNSNQLLDTHVPLILAWRGASVDLSPYIGHDPYYQNFWRLYGLSDEDMNRPILELVRRPRPQPANAAVVFAGRRADSGSAGLRHQWTDCPCGQPGIQRLRCRRERHPDRQFQPIPVREGFRCDRHPGTRSR